MRTVIFLYHNHIIHRNKISFATHWYIVSQVVFHTDQHVIILVTVHTSEISLRKLKLSLKRHLLGSQKILECETKSHVRVDLNSKMITCQCFIIIY